MKPDDRLLTASKNAAIGILSMHDRDLWDFCLENASYLGGHCVDRQGRAEVLESLAYDGVEVKS